MTAETVRKMVPLSPEELVDLDTVRTAGTIQNAALIELAGDAAVRSEAATLHALVELGLRSLQDRALEHGYAALAASQDDEDLAYRAAVRDRRRGNADD